MYILIELHFHNTSQNQTAQLQLYVSKNSPPLPTYIILRPQIETKLLGLLKLKYFESVILKAY